MSKYVCCGGYLPCAGKCGEKSCPECCLFLDTWIIATMIALQYLACIMRCVAIIVDVNGVDTAADAIDIAADVVWCTVCACMAAQHDTQIAVRDGKRAPSADAGVQAVAPAAQQMQR